MVKWLVKDQDEQTIQYLAQTLGTDPVIARLLYNRGLRSTEDINRFFDIDLSHLHDPMLLLDVENAVKRIEQALENDERITVYGDYDVDGITSVVVLYKYLVSRGGKVDYYIPDRAEEGYGLNNTALESIREKGTSLVITVDMGTTAVEEIRRAKDIGLDIIVTDHHECKEDIPECIAVINPKRPDSTYPYKDLAGVGVVFKLICALMGDSRAAFERFGDLVAIGTVADIMPLIDENRVLVSLGLSLVQRKPSIGIKALMEAAGGYRQGGISAGLIAYQIAPRLNAAGRIGDPKMSVALLLSDNYEDAAYLSNALCDENRQRQQMEQDILNDVEAKLLGPGRDDKIIIVASDNWHQGVIGIVASRIVERYHKPCILVCFEGDKAKGSARSVRGVSIFDLLCKVGDSLEKFGGHEMAAGLTLKRECYEEFVSRITEVANKEITEEMLIPVIETECELPQTKLDLDFVREIYKLEPFGTGNPTPNFLIRNVRITELYSVGAGKHVKLTLDTELGHVSAMCFGKKICECEFALGDTVDIVCSLGENTYNGRSSISLNVKCVRLEEGIVAEENRLAALGECFMQTGTVCGDMFTKREELICLYKYLIRQRNAQQHSFMPFALARSVSNTCPSFNYCKLLVCLKTLEEVGILKVEYGDIFNIDIIDSSSKVDLNRSETWKKVCR